ncbi:1-acyl-sn-glycerol-3-phosphate acyltransferase [Candidatus Atribacteria bacterium HGW-Atribacteria-1]|nr:MAG: 1-acyl-sn-glycerol-3-phosphate acyltransferase [Candidatus Atribacteria bacterium HGW-Atribacteria-1]
MFYYVARAMSWLLLKLFWRMEVIGIENLPKTGGLIVASNHVSYLDPVVLGTSMKRKISFITKKEAFNNIFGSFILKNLNAFPVNRESIDILAFKKAISILREGGVLGIFPEGTRSLNGELQELKLGVIKIAMKTGIPILPVGIIGTHKIYSHGKNFPTLFKYKITVYYGPLQYFDKGKIGDRIYQKEALNILSQKIKELTNSHK